MGYARTSTLADDLRRFYDCLRRLGDRIGGPRVLCNCDGRSAWPGRGVYFFFEPGEHRTGSGEGSRVVRVGTHALTARSRTTLWNRLSQHRGVARTGGGNHRGSIFRLLVGLALPRRNAALAVPTWAVGSSAPLDVRARESELEQAVSGYIGAMPFLWVAVEDDAGADSDRGRIERGAIALLARAARESVDPPSPGWLGLDCPRERVARSGLWNQNHVDEDYAPAFLSVLERWAEATPAHHGG